MPDFSLIQGSNRYETVAAAAGTSSGTTVSTGASNSKGSYTQLIASTAFAATGIMVYVRPTTGANDYLIDIAIGAAASENIIVANLLVTGRMGLVQAFFPIPIPAGTRIAARGQNTSAGAVNVAVMCVLFSSPLLSGAPLGRVTTYGANTADSGGVSIDPGGSANTKGSYSEITSSTTNRIRQLLILLGAAANTIQTNANVLLDLAIGAGGSETIVIADIPFGISDAELFTPMVLGPFPVNIPAGTRLAARAQCSITDATDRLFDVVVYGVD